MDATAPQNIPDMTARAIPAPFSVMGDLPSSLSRASGWQRCGIGFVLTERDPFTCIDLDGCIGYGDVLSPLAQEIGQGFPRRTVEDGS